IEAADLVKFRKFNHFLVLLSFPYPIRSATGAQKPRYSGPRWRLVRLRVSPPRSAAPLAFPVSTDSNDGTENCASRLGGTLHRDNRTEASLAFPATAAWCRSQTRLERVPIRPRCRRSLSAPLAFPVLSEP